MSKHSEEIAEIRALIAEREKMALQREAAAEERALQREAAAEERAIQREKERAIQREKERLEDKKKEALEREKEAVRKAELDAAIKKAFEGVTEARAELCGIGESNGMFTEEYFHNSLKNSMSFAGINFDEIDRGLKKTLKKPDGNKLQGEYDVIMYNGDSIALIEIKYRGRKIHVDKLITKMTNNFKELFPKYANYKFYLGIASMAFEEGAVEEALEKGVGILRPKGESVEIIDHHVRAF